MSLELALQENTAAVNALAALLSKINLAPAAEAPPAKKQKAAAEVAAAMERAATPTTAEQPAAPESKVADSAEQSPSPVNVEPAAPVVEPLTHLKEKRHTDIGRHAQRIRLREPAVPFGGPRAIQRGGRDRHLTRDGQRKHSGSGSEVTGDELRTIVAH